VSLLSVNQLLAVLGTDSVAIVNRVRGLRGHIVDQKQANFPQLLDDSNGETVIWQRAIIQLDSLISSMKVKPKAQLNITLASDFVRYLALPPQQIYMNFEEKLAYANAAFREIYGSVVDDWEVRLQDTPAQDTTIIAAIDKKLLEALNQTALKHQLKLITVKPYLMSAYNCLTKQIGSSSGYLVVVEFKRLLLINLLQGKCMNVRMFNLGSDWQSELKSLMVRESVLNDNIKQAVLVYAPVQKNIVINTIDGWVLKRITLKNTLSNYHFAMLEVAL
jgi:hypothetical protein